ncbi:protein ABHD18 isoform X2 [Vanessa cardui]|nr:protein ABHD18 isoform X2 [Vanessa cardui]
MVKPLIKEAGIGGIILENPFYGLRKPTDQIRSSLHNVSDIFVMGGCLILESLVLFHWCERNGLGPLGVTGLSMGGHMASLAATNWPKPLVLVPCLSWSTASAVFLQGVMSHSINWDLLEDQYLSDGAYREKLSKMVTIVDEAFLAGKKFARTYSQNMDNNSKPSVDTKPQNAIIDSLDCNSLKKVDITYKEAGGDKLRDGNEDCNKDIVTKPNVPFNTTRISNKDEEKLKENLKVMLENNKITEVLYNKLTSNKNFELEPQDIENINKLTDGRIKLLLLKYKDLEKEKKQINITNEAESKTVNDNNSGHKDISSEQLLENASNKIVKPNASDVEIKPTESSELTIANNKKDKKPWTVSDFTSDLWVNLPFFKPSGKKIDIGKIHWRDREALQFMRGIMDECTHLSNFSIPFDTSLIIAVCAKHDAYVPRDDVGTLEEIWPGAEVRYVDAGHVSAYILHQSLFRSCIMEAFERSKKKWNDGKHL